jgi:iron complex outermembrane recepter protein
MKRFLAGAALGGAFTLAWSSFGAAQEGGTSQPIELEGIVVTGELIERPIEETANSAEVLDKKALEEKPALRTVRNVLELTPNVSVVTGTAKAPTVRGVDGTGPAENSNAFFAGSRPRLSWQVDGRPASYNEIIFGDAGIWDLERVEVLRGPQSTLVGRNAIAGTIIVETNDPTFDVGAEAQSAVGNLGQRRLSGMVNFPVIDNVMAVRLSADWHTRSSPVSYQSYEGVSDPGDIEAMNLRGKILLLPQVGVDTRLLLSFVHNQYQAPQGEIVVRPFEDQVSNFPQQPVHIPVTDSLGVEFSTALSDDVKLEVNASATEFEFERKAPPNTSNATIDTTEYVLEPRLRYKDADGYSGVLGVYLYQARQDEFIEFLGGQNFDDSTDTIAGYAEGIVPLTGTLDLLWGARYEHEDRRRKGGDPAGVIANIDMDETYEAFLPKLGVNWKATENTSVGAQISRGYNAGGGGISFGFPNPFPIVHYQYDSEYVLTYEIYGRQKFLDGRLRTRQNVFFSDYTDMQLPFDLTPDDSRDEAFIVRNADRAITYGAEFGADASVTETITLFGSFGLLWTEITAFPGSGVEGNALTTAPNVTASLGFLWHDGPWKASAVARYSDAYFTDINNRPRGKTDPYVVTDAQVSYDFGSFELFSSVRNLLNADDPIALYPGVAPGGSGQPDSAFDSAVLLQPRSFLVGIKAKY